MKNLNPLPLVAALVAGIATLASPAPAEAQDTFSPTGAAGTYLTGFYATAPGVFFTPTSNLTLTGLGAYTGGFTTTVGPLTESTQQYNVGLYDVTSDTFEFYTSIISGAVPDGNDFVYGALPVADTGFQLVAGQEYEVVDFAGLYDQGSDYYVPGASPDNPDAPQTPYIRDRVAGFGSGNTILAAGPDVTLDTYEDTDGFVGNGGVFPSDYPAVSIEPGTTDTPLDTGVIGPNILYTVDLSVPEPSSLAYLALGGAALFFVLRRRTANVRE